MEQIEKALRSFEQVGIKVLAPATSELVDPNEEFVVLTTDDPNKAPHKLEIGFMREIRKADFLYVADVDGYVGQSVATEMAYARLKNLPVVIGEEIKNFSGEIPVETRELLRRDVIGILNINDISKEKVREIKDKIGNHFLPELTKDEKKKLLSLIKQLLKDLKHL